MIHDFSSLLSAPECPDSSKMLNLFDEGDAYSIVDSKKINRLLAAWASGTKLKVLKSC